MNITERIYVFCDKRCISLREFEKKCGFSNGYIAKLKGDHLKLDKIDSILSAYPELSKKWLLYESGSMIVGEDNADCDPAQSSNIEKHESANEVKMIDIIHSQQTTIERLTKIIENMVVK